MYKPIGLKIIILGFYLMINIYKPFYSIHQILVIYIIFVFLLSACTGRTSNHGVLNIDNNIQKMVDNITI